MRPFLEKLNLAERNSFYAKTHSTPYFEVGWHQHPELEIIYIREGFGNAFIGDYVGAFKEGDIFFLGSHVAHTFQKAYDDLFVSAVVIQFREDFWGNSFLNLPECKELKLLFEQAQHGIKINGSTKKILAEKILEMEDIDGLAKIIRLTECLQLIKDCGESEPLSMHELKEFNCHNKERIDKVHQFTIENYYESITLEQVAAIASMSVPAFCNYFKKCTKKTYIEFLNEVRIENACRLLVETEKSINEIGFNSGFNTLPNFNKQFHKVKKMTPSHYRRMFQKNLVLL